MNTLPSPALPPIRRTPSAAPPFPWGNHQGTRAFASWSACFALLVAGWVYGEINAGLASGPVIVAVTSGAALVLTLMTTAAEIRRTFAKIRYRRGLALRPWVQRLIATYLWIVLYALLITLAYLCSLQITRAVIGVESLQVRCLSV